MTEATTQRDANLTWIFPFHGEKEKEKEEQNFKEGGKKNQQTLKQNISQFNFFPQRRWNSGSG